eukprot:6124509-Amphidinium_carterae.1
MGTPCSLHLRPERGRFQPEEWTRTAECVFLTASSVAFHGGVCAVMTVRSLPELLLDLESYSGLRVGVASLLCVCVCVCVCQLYCGPFVAAITPLQRASSSNACGVGMHNHVALARARKARMGQAGDQM